MKQILWFRRDLRVEDNAILANAKGEVLPIFIFDKNILSNLEKDDKRVTFIFRSVQRLKKQLQKIGLDLAIFYGKPTEIFNLLKNDYDEVLCSIDFDEYSKKRDEEIENIIPLKKFIDSFILNPKEHLKKDGSAYKVFTPFYNSLLPLTSSTKLELYERDKNIILSSSYDYKGEISLKEMGFEEQSLPLFLDEDTTTLFNSFSKKLKDYKEDRDYFFKDATSKFSIFLRFGIISPKQVFNYFKSKENSDFFIRELFWREFYNYILFHNPNSQFENFNGLQIKWNEDEEDYKKWCEGNTGVPIIDAAMRCLNDTGMMHNRLRMIVASFLTKNLFVDWKKGESYFAKKLLDYEASSNIGSWQWSASTGADAVPYFRVFNPYTQSKKFDKDAIFIKSVLTQLKDLPPRLFHMENGVQSNLFVNYPKSMVSINNSRKMAIQRFKELKNESI